MRERRVLAILAASLVAVFLAVGFFSSADEARRLRLFVREREAPALGLAAAAQLDVAAFNYRQAGEDLLADDFILGWIDSGERDPAALMAFMERVRAKHGLLDASIVSDRTETYYGTDGRVLKLSPENAERDGWYYLYRETVLETTIDAWYYPETGLVGMYVNVPLIDREGRYRGVVGGGIDTAEFSRILESIEEDRGLRVYLARRDGQIVYATDRALLAPPPRNLDELWGTRISDSLRREQKSLDGLLFEPEGARGGSILWGRYLPDWDTFLVIEWGADALGAIARENASAFLPSRWGESLALLAVSAAAIIVAYRAIRSAERREEALRLRHQAVVACQDRLLSGAEALLAGRGVDEGPGSPASRRRGELGNAVGRRRRAFERFLRGGGEDPGADDRRELAESGPSLEAAVQEAVLRASAAALRGGVAFRLEGGAGAVELDPEMLGMALDELLEAMIRLASAESEIMIGIRGAPGSAILDVALRLDSAQGNPSPGAEPARLLLAALGVALEELEPEPGLRVFRAALPLGPRGPGFTPPSRRTRSRSRGRS